MNLILPLAASMSLAPLAQARHAVNSPEFHWAEREKRRLEKKMGILDPDGEPIRAPTPDDIKKLSCFWKNECDEYRQAATIYQEARRRERTHYTEALKMAKSAYRIKYASEGPILSGPPSWVRNGYMRFNPVFSPAPPDDGKADEWDAVTARDGTMFFRPKAFVNARGEADPAMLALTLQHEAYHMMLFLEPGRDLRNIPQVERDLRFLALAREGIYQLKTEDWKRLLKDVAGYDYMMSNCSRAPTSIPSTARSSSSGRVPQATTSSI